jgi:ketosteroid isomerase-like protein
MFDRALLSRLEFLPHMSRFLFSFLAVSLICCVAPAQSPSSDPAISTPGAATSSVTNTSAATTTESPDVARLQKIEDSWSDAVNRRDQYGLELVLSPLFVDVSASGDVTTRNQQIVQVISGDDKTIYLSQKVITVRMLGDIAVANGTYTLHHKVNSAQVDEKGIFTHVFERTHGGWLCINSQRTVLRPDPKARQKKSSTAEMPFHIPFFSKDDKGPQGPQ